MSFSGNALEPEELVANHGILTTAPDIAREGMTYIPGGSFLMGLPRRGNGHAPGREHTEVGPFYIDTFPVTNRQFAQFVDQTGYVTRAERGVQAKEYPGIGFNCTRPGALQYRPARSPTHEDHWEVWWVSVPGASWYRPEGTVSVFADRMDHPVTCVTYEDARAFARWAGKSLPTEAQWEYAARGGLENAEFAWGNEFAPHGRRMANTWAGDRFPYDETPFRAYRTTAVGSFPHNDFGLYDMIGNVWEWTRDRYVDAKETDDASHGHEEDDTPRIFRDRLEGPPFLRMPAYVVKGGSFLCSPNYCSGFKPGARQGQSSDTASVHIGFRCVVAARSMPL